MAHVDDKKLWDELLGELAEGDREPLVRRLREEPALESERQERAQLIADVRATLRAEVPLALTSAQRAEIFAQTDMRAPKPMRIARWALAACLMLIGVRAVAYYAYVLPEQQRMAAEREANERITRERAAEVRRLQEEAQVKLQQAQEQAIAAQEAAAAAVLERAQSMSMRKADLRMGAGKASVQPCRTDECRKARKGSTSAGSSQSSCNPNDPLCGL